MTASTYLSPRRIGRLFRKDIVELHRQSLVMVGAVFGVYLAIYLLSVFTFTRGGNVTIQLGAGTGRQNLHQVLFALLLFFGGFIVTSRAFYEAHSRFRNHDWLMLPASTLEKFAERWFLTSIGYAVAAVLSYSLFSVVSAGIARALLKSSYAVFNPLSRTTVELCLNYVVAQSFFLLGAAYFRKNHFIKTVLALLGVSIALTFFTAVVFRIVYWDFFKGVAPNVAFAELGEEIERSVRSRNLERTATGLETAANWIKWALLLPTVWTIAFFRLKETEVKDGV